MPGDSHGFDRSRGHSTLRSSTKSTKEKRIEEGHLMGDHVHMCISIPPKYAVSNGVGEIKGKSAIAIARQFGKKVSGKRGQAQFLLHSHHAETYTCTH
jgi:putative transposase